MVSFASRSLLPPKEGSTIAIVQEGGGLAPGRYGLCGVYENALFVL